MRLLHVLLSVRIALNIAQILSAFQWRMALVHAFELAHSCLQRVLFLLPPPTERLNVILKRGAHGLHLSQRLA